VNSTVELLRYNLWGNERTIEACRGLSDDQLNAPATGTHGPVRATLLHLVDGQRTFLARLEGQAQPAGGPATSWPGWDAIERLAAETGEALVAAAESLGEQRDVELAYMGKRYRYPAAFFLLHAIEHGIEHRAQINVMLAQVGVAHPDLDGWAYAAAAGFGEEV
jgi:uncharacterized damage-inducible protein DinB